MFSAELVQRLAKWRSGDHPVVSLYLNVDGKKKIRPEDYIIHLEALIKEALAKEPAKTVVDDLERVRLFVTEEFDRGSNRGLAIFTSGDALWEVVPLPVPVDDHLAINMSPHVRQLETIVDAHEPVGVLLTDKQRARLMVIEFGRVVEREEVVDPLPRHDDDKGDWLKDHVKTHANVAAAQHLKRAAQAMFDLLQRHPFTRLVLGVADELRPEAERQLHAYLRSRLIAGCSLSVSASDDEVIAVVQEHDRRAERAQESQYVDRLRAAVLANEAAGRTNGDSTLGVAGLEHTLKAVFERRVDTLLVSEGYTAEGWRCTACGFIAIRGRTCAMCGVEMTHVSDVVEEAVEDALVQKCRVEFCIDNADLDVLGRIGALLRF